MHIYLPERPKPEADRWFAYAEYLLLRALFFLLLGSILYKLRSLRKKSLQNKEE